MLYTVYLTTEDQHSLRLFPFTLCTPNTATVTFRILPIHFIFTLPKKIEIAIEMLWISLCKYSFLFYFLTDRWTLIHGFVSPGKRSPISAFFGKCRGRTKRWRICSSWGKSGSADAPLRRRRLPPFSGKATVSRERLWLGKEEDPPLLSPRGGSWADLLLRLLLRGTRCRSAGARPGEEEHLRLRCRRGSWLRLCGRWTRCLLRREVWKRLERLGRRESRRFLLLRRGRGRFVLVLCRLTSLILRIVLSLR